MNPPAFSPSLPPLQKIYEDPLQHHMPASKRPKLSLQTSLPSVPYGVSSSQAGSNRVDNMATPTTRNTIANQYHTFDLSIRPSPVSTTASPAATAVSRPIARNKRSLPYDLNLPIGKRSILKNSSFPVDVRRGSLSAAASASPRSASGGRRVFFPEPKRVKFGLDEDIVTSRYTARHVDLSSSSEDEASSSGSESGAYAANEGEEEEGSDQVSVTNKLLSKRGEAVIVDELQRGRNAARSDTRPRTTKKRRRWEWTLGSVEAKGAQHSGNPIEGALQAETTTEDLSSPSNASTSSSPSVATPSTPFEVKAKEPDVTVAEVVPTPTSATVKVQEGEEVTLAQL